MKAWTKGAIELKGWQFIPERMAELGLTMEDGLVQAWFVTADGRLTGGAEAINLSMRYVWWARPFTWLYSVPGIRQLQDRAYRWIADNRHKMPGSTDACAIDSKIDPKSQ
ncbi:MAG: putative DCC family thiol-disulfide oxidoreductase YuxK [Candidatus Promineifilaceae bacterium]